MNKIKLFLCVALFGAMSFGAFSAYEHYTMSEEERFLLANVEALTQLEDDYDTGITGQRSCYDSYSLEESVFGSKRIRFRRCEGCIYIEYYDPTDRTSC